MAAFCDFAIQNIGTKFWMSGIQVLTVVFRY